jgi:hypothetical protein
MVMWLALSLIGFLVLTALVVVMGTRSTARYEAEKAAASRNRTAAPEPVRSAVTAAVL